jgi:hypothetical protein
MLRLIFDMVQTRLTDDSPRRTSSPLFLVEKTHFTLIKARDRNSNKELHNDQPASHIILSSFSPVWTLSINDSFQFNRCDP